MNFKNKISLLFRSRANEALLRMEDPRETIDYFYQTELENLQKLRRLAKEQSDTCQLITNELSRLERNKARLLENSEAVTAEAGQVKYGNAASPNEQLTTIDQSISVLRRQEEHASQQMELTSRQSEAWTTRLHSLRTYKEMLKADYRSAQDALRTSELYNREEIIGSRTDDDRILKLGPMLDLLSPDWGTIVNGRTRETIGGSEQGQ